MISRLVLIAAASEVEGLPCPIPIETPAKEALTKYLTIGLVLAGVVAILILVGSVFIGFEGRRLRPAPSFCANVAAASQWQACSRATVMGLARAANFGRKTPRSRPPGLPAPGLLLTYPPRR